MSYQARIDRFIIYGTYKCLLKHPFLVDTAITKYLVPGIFMIKFKILVDLAIVLYIGQVVVSDVVYQILWHSSHLPHYSA